MARLYRYTVTGRVSYPFEQEVLAACEDEAEEAIEAMGSDVNVNDGEPSVEIDSIDPGWDGDDDETYTPKEGGYLDDESLY